MKDDPMITMALAAVFIIGMLWVGWLNGIREWIRSKVVEGGA